jgi:hypothetical protein
MKVPWGRKLEEENGKLFRRNCAVGQRMRGRGQVKERLSELVVSSRVAVEQ